MRASIFTSCVSGRGNLYVCLSVFLRSDGWSVGPTNLKFGTHIKDHHILDGFEGQGHRSKVKVISQGQVWVKVSQGHEGQGKKCQTQGRRLSVKIVCKVLYPICTCRRCDTRAFSLWFSSKSLNTSMIQLFQDHSKSLQALCARPSGQMILIFKIGEIGSKTKDGH